MTVFKKKKKAKSYFIMSYSIVHKHEAHTVTYYSSKSALFFVIHL